MLRSSMLVRYQGDAASLDGIRECMHRIQVCGVQAQPASSSFCFQNSRMQVLGGRMLKVRLQIEQLELQGC